MLRNYIAELLHAETFAEMDDVCRRYPKYAPNGLTDGIRHGIIMVKRGYMRDGKGWQSKTALYRCFTLTALAEERGITMYKFLEEVAKNIEAEADAIEKYSELLAVADNEIDEFNDLEFVHSEIAEIISDELNHIDRLKRMFSHFSGIETAED